MATALVIAPLCALSFAVAAPIASADTLPSGEVTFGQTVIEPAYDAANGTIVYLSTPQHGKINPNFTHNVAPIYLPVYPAGTAFGTLNCMDVPVENCPDHGPEIAGLAESVDPTVYGGGVEGHDHLVGIASTGGDFNVLWEPVVVLFNTPEAVTHVTTLAQITSLENAGLVTLVRLPAATFHCAVVPAAVYARGVPFNP